MGSIYPKLHTDYGFCPLPRYIKQFEKKISVNPACHRWWSVRPAIHGGCWHSTREDGRANHTRALFE